MPAGAIENEYGVGAGSDGSSDLGEVGVHGLGVGVGQDETGGGGAAGTNRTEYVGPFIAGVANGPGAGAALRPDPGERALLTYSCFVLKPDLERLAVGCLGEGCGDSIGEVFLNIS